MRNRKLKFAQIVWVVLLCLGITFFNVINSHATPLTGTEVIYSGPTVGGVSWYTQYWLETDQYGTLDAFCVEEWGVSDASYELVDVPEDLVVEAQIASLYYSGSVLAQTSISDATTAKVATQLAIWDSLDMIDGLNEQSWIDYVAEINDLLLPAVSSSVFLARSPVGGAAGPSQDYLVSIPDASIMFLLGPAMIGMAIFRRKRKS